MPAVARNLGHDPAELVLNRETFRHAQIKFRKEAAKEIEAAFNPVAVPIVHRDGKIIPESDSGGGIVDCLPVLVTGWSGQAPRRPKAPVPPSIGLRSGRAHCAGGLAA